MSLEGADPELIAEHRRIEKEAREFLVPLLPMLDLARASMFERGQMLRCELLVGPYPIKAPGNPIKAGFFVSLKGDGIRSGGTCYTLESYMPDELPWLAATIEAQIEEHLSDPPFGSLGDSVRNLIFHKVKYDRVQDHEHCGSCFDAIILDEDNPTASEAFVSDPASSEYQIWLCPRCFQYWAPLRNLSEEK